MQPNQSKSKGLIIGIIVILVLVIAGLLVYFLVFAKNSDNPKNKNEYENNTGIQSTNKVGDTSPKTIVSLGIEYTQLPAYKYRFYDNENVLNVLVSDKEVITIFNVIKGSIDYCRNSIEEIKNIFIINFGGSIQKIENKEYNGVDFITMETIIENEKMMFVLGELNSEVTLVSLMLNTDKIYPYSLVDDFAEIIKNAKVSNNSSFSPSLSIDNNSNLINRSKQMFD